MRKTTVSVLSLFCAILLMIPAFISCGDTPVPDATASPETTAAAPVAETTVVPEETTEPLASLEVKDLGGYEFKVLWPSIHNDGHFVHNEIDCDTENGDSIDSAVYTRNARVEEKYNITITGETEWCSTIPSRITKYVTSGDKPYDAFCAPIAMVTTPALSGVCADYNSMTYYSEDQQWWQHGIMSEFAIGKSRYFGCGDIIYSDNFYPYSIFVNMDMYGDYKFTENLADLVNQKQWTLDKLMEMCKAVPVSADDTWDYQDTYGIVINPNLAKAIYYGAGKQTVLFDSEGKASWAMTPEVVEPILDKVLTLFHTDNMAYDTDEDIGHGYPGLTHAQSAIKMFTGNQTLFYSEELIVAERLTKNDSDVNYSLVPIPMFSSDQSRYYCVMNDAVVVCVPSNQDLERTSLILSAMGRESIDTVTDAFFGIVLNYKYVADAESQKMLNLILESAKAPDVGTILGWGGVVNSYKKLAQLNQTGFASTYESAKKTVTNSVKSFNKLLP